LPKTETDMSLEDFELGFTLSSDMDSYYRLCQFENAMRMGQYIPISDEDIRKGVDYERARMKAILKFIDNKLGRDISNQEKAIIDTYCENWYHTFKSYNDSHKKSC
jgi:hypothetical protein